MRKTFAIIALIVLFIVIGAWREIIFVNINAQIFLHSHPEEQNWVVPYLSWLKNMSVRNLLLAKWLLTLIFTLFHYLLAAYFFTWPFPHPRAKKWLNYSYITLFCLAGGFYSLSYFTNSDSGYVLARVIMGALQSPVILMILIPATFLQKQIR